MEENKPVLFFIPFTSGAPFSNGNSVYGPCRDDADLERKVLELWPGGKDVVILGSCRVRQIRKPKTVSTVAAPKPSNGFVRQPVFVSS